MWILLALTASAHEPEPLRSLPTYHNVAWISEVTAPLDWYADGDCVVSVSDGPLRRTCGVDVTPDPSQPPRLLPNQTEPLPYVGTWREVRVQERVVFPERAPTGERQAAGGAVVFAQDQAGGLRHLTTIASPHAALCLKPDDCDPRSARWLGWRAPAEIEGTSLALAWKEGGAYAEAQTALMSAVQERLANGEAPPGRPPSPTSPPAPMAMRWEIQINHTSTRVGTCIYDALPLDTWTLDVPLSGPTRSWTRTVQVVDATVSIVAEADLAAQELRIEVTGPDGETSRGIWPFSLPTTERMGTTVAALEPQVSTGVMTTLGPAVEIDGPLPWVTVTPVRHLVRSPVAGRSDPISGPTPAPPSDSNATIRVPRSLRLTQAGERDLVVDAHGAVDEVRVLLSPELPLVLLAELFVGSASAPDLTWTGGVVAPEQQFPFRLPVPGVWPHDAWIIVRWMQAERTVYAQEWRAPGTTAREDARPWLGDGQAPTSLSVVLAWARSADPRLQERGAWGLLRHPRHGGALLRAMLLTPPAPTTSADGVQTGWTWHTREAAWRVLAERGDLPDAIETVESLRLGP